MSGKIFISYRRDDDPNGAARVRDALAAKFGKASIFMDVDNLLAGLRFDEELAKALASCDVFIAIIGTRWLDLLKAKAAGGERDFVCEEISGALKRKIAVIPVRVGREGQLAPLPRTEDLPPEIADLVHYQKHDVTHEHFGRDASALSEAIIAVRQHLRPAGASALPHVPWRWIAATAASVLSVGYTSAYYAGVPVPWPWAPSTQTVPSPTKEQLEAAARQNVLREQEAKRIADQKAADDARAQKATADAAEAKRKADEADRQRAAAAEAKRLADAAAAKKAQDEEAERERIAAELRHREAAAKAKAEDDRKRAEPATAMQAGRVFRDCADGCPEMVVVPAGTFMMGEGSSQRRTSIAQPFAVGKFEVTFAEWEACVGGGGCTSNKSPSDQGWGKDRRPVINVSRNDAKEYVSWISRKTGKSYLLLTEAEWEYAARAGTTTAYSWGEAIGRGNANCDGCGSQWDNKQTAPVGSFKPNDFGLHDMHGNVLEWCEEAVGSSSRFLRGGSWNYNPYNVRSAYRNDVQGAGRHNNVGFRVARTL